MDRIFFDMHICSLIKIKLTPAPFYFDCRVEVRDDQIKWSIYDYM